MKYTENYNLKKPEAEDFYNVEDFNDNADIIDQVLKTHDDTLATLDAHVSDGTQHAKTVRFVIGTSTAGWTENDVDYLCDGTNDHVEINQAIQNLPVNGGEIIILSGIYNIGAKININKNNVTIRGNGNATVLKRMWNSSSAEGVITLNSVEGCWVENLQIDGNKATYTASYNYGIYLSSSTNNTIIGNTCNNNSGYGIYLSSSTNNTIIGNICNNNNNSGIYLYSSSNNNMVTDNTCNNSGYGIYLFSSTNNTIIGNICNNNNSGIYLGSSSNNTVTGNTCNNNNHQGIYLSSSTNNTVTGNTCNNSSSGIYLGSSSNNTVTGNTCNNSSNRGIYLASSSNNNTVTGNTCNNSSSGIYLYSSTNNTITGNTCIRGTGQPSDYTSSQYTIRVSGSGNGYNLISSNNCMGKDVVIEDGTNNTSVNNKYN